MAAAAPDILVRRGIDRGLVGTILASAAIHAAAVTLLITMPGRFLSAPAPMESYTVDLVAPDVIGGTTLVAGRGKAKAPASKPAPPLVAEPQPAPAAAAVAAAALEPDVGPHADVPKAPPPEPPKPAPQPPQPVAPAHPVAPAVPKHEAPNPPDPRQPAAIEPPAAKPAAPPKPPPVAEAKPPEPQAALKPPEPPKPVAKAAEAPKPPPAAAKPVPAANPAPAEVQKKPSEQPSSATAAPHSAKQRDDEIAAAVQRRAAQMRGASGASPELDKQIAAAVQRRAQQVDAGAGGGTSGAGGPVSVGPASGIGGTPAGLEYILYQGRMEERIKAAWAWAGADKSLRAVIQFNLTPDGDIRNVRTVQSSGDSQYDASCERAVRAVNQLDPVPEKYRKEFSSVEMTFKPSDLEP